MSGRFVLRNSLLRNSSFCDQIDGKATQPMTALVMLACHRCKRPALKRETDGQDCIVIVCMEVGRCDLIAAAERKANSAD